MNDKRIEELSHEAGRRLKARHAVLATAESCTGGWVAQAITSIAGSSEWFDRGFVTYSNESKQDLLAVPVATLDEFGAVSEETARAMASGALARSCAHLAVSITGIAGPGGGSPGRPVGTVCFAWANGVGVRSERCLFSGDRQAIRRQAVVRALEGVLASIDALPAPV